LRTPPTWPAAAARRLPVLEEIWAGAKERKLPVHLDGARIFNAATALGVDVRELTAASTR
jgi:threonine aldolase